MTADRHASLDQLAILGARDDHLAVAGLLPDLRARLATGGGNALTGLPTGSAETPLPFDVGVSDLLDDISAHTAYLARTLLDAGVTLTATTATGRLKQAAYEAWRTITTDAEAIALWDTARDLRERAETILGAKVRADWLGPCPTAGCPAEVYLRADQHARVCGECGAVVTRQGQAEHAATELDERLLTLSELASALVVCRVPVPYRTLQTWARRGRIPEHVEWQAWRGIPYPLPRSGLYPFAAAYRLACERHGARIAAA